MTKAHSINRDIRDAATYGQSAYLETAKAGEPSRMVRIARTRTQRGKLQALCVSTGDWIACDPKKIDYRR